MLTARVLGLTIRHEPWSGRPDLDLAGAWASLDRLAPRGDAVVLERLIHAGLAGAVEGWGQRKKGA